MACTSQVPVAPSSSPTIIAVIRPSLDREVAAKVSEDAFDLDAIRSIYDHVVIDSVDVPALEALKRPSSGPIHHAYLMRGPSGSGKSYTSSKLFESYALALIAYGLDIHLSCFEFGPTGSKVWDVLHPDVRPGGPPRSLKILSIDMDGGRHISLKPPATVVEVTGKSTSRSGTQMKGKHNADLTGKALRAYIASVWKRTTGNLSRSRTGNNEESSRKHAILELLAVNPGTISDPNHARLHGSTIRIFDLAGDEDAQRDVIGDNNNSSRVQESVRITQSLKAISRLSYLLAHGNGRGDTAEKIEAKKQLSKIQKDFPVCSFILESMIKCGSDLLLMCTMTRHDRDADKRELLRLFAKRFKGLKDASVQHMAGDVRLQGPVIPPPPVLRLIQGSYQEEIPTVGTAIDAALLARTSDEIQQLKHSKHSLEQRLEGCEAELRQTLALLTSTQDRERQLSSIVADLEAAQESVKDQMLADKEEEERRYKAMVMEVVGEEQKRTASETQRIQRRDADYEELRQSHASISASLDQAHEDRDALARQAELLVEDKRKLGGDMVRLQQAIDDLRVELSGEQHFNKLKCDALQGQLEREKSTSDSLRETLTDQQRTHTEQSARLEAELSIAKTSLDEQMHKSTRPLSQASEPADLVEESAMLAEGSIASPGGFSMNVNERETVDDAGPAEKKRKLNDLLAQSWVFRYRATRS